MYLKHLINLCTYSSHLFLAVQISSKTGEKDILCAQKLYQVSLTRTRFLAIKIIDSNVKKLTRTLLHLFSSLDYERDPVYEKNTTQLSHFIHKSLYKCIHISDPCTNCFVFFKVFIQLDCSKK